jgi:hypothetical protein
MAKAKDSIVDTDSTGWFRQKDSIVDTDLTGWLRQ